MKSKVTVAIDSIHIVSNLRKEGIGEYNEYNDSLLHFTFEQTPREWPLVVCSVIAEFIPH